MDPEHWLGIGVVAVVLAISMLRRKPGGRRGNSETTSDTTSTLATDWGDHTADGCDSTDSGDFGCSDGGSDD